MASVLHGSARTTPRIRAELQASKESARSLAARYDLNARLCGSGAADHDGRCADGSEGSEEHGADASRGSHRGGVPPEDVVAAGRRAGLPEGYAFPISAGAPCTVACQRHGIPGCRRKRPAISATGSRATRSAMSTSTAANCDTPTASWSCSWRSTGSRNSPTSSSTTAPGRRREQLF